MSNSIINILTNFKREHQKIIYKHAQLTQSLISAVHELEVVTKEAEQKEKDLLKFKQENKQILAAYEKLTTVLKKEQQ
ncbi:MAG: hypothetical protein ACXAEU_22910 [Candidatus Hodarchaeales archaeon]|jgi:hypothetical protein